MTLPNSWTAVGNVRSKQLGDWMDLVAPVPSGKKIYFNEYTPDTSSRNVRFSRGVDSAAIMEFLVNTDSLTDPTLMPILTKSIIGGYWRGDGLKHTPFQHPFFNAGVNAGGMYAKDIVQVVDMGSSESNQLYGTYNVSKLTVSFETNPYWVDLEYNPVTDDYNPNWLVFENRATNNRISTAIGLYRFQDAAPVPSIYRKKPCMTGNFFTQPTDYINLKFLEVPDSFLYTIDGFLIQFADSFGLVNDDTFGNCPAGTLLLDGIETFTYSDWVGNLMHTVSGVLMYNGDNWNNVRNPSGPPNPVEYFAADPSTGSRRKPFLDTSFKVFFNQLNPR